VITTYQVLPNDDGTIDLQPIKGRDSEKDVEVLNNRLTDSVKVIKNDPKEDPNG
jgi:hypothetical protein